jgi:hypothetical protein
MLLYRRQNAGQNHDIKIANRPFESVAQFKYLGTAITDQNLIQGKLRGNCIRVIFATIRPETFLSSRLLSKNVKIIIYNTIILPVDLYGCETLVSDINQET